MSAANIICQAERVTLVADAGYFALDGTLNAIGSKIVVLPDESCAWVARGGEGAAGLVEEWFRELGSHDAIVAAAARVVRMAGMVERMRREGAASEYFECEISFIGRSAKRGRLEAFSVATSGAPDSLLPDLHPCNLLAVAPDPTDGDFFTLASGGMTLDDIDFDTWDALLYAEIAGRLIDAQRAFVGGANGQPMVAGFAEIVTITTTTMRREQIRSWPDAIGERVALSHA